jgi:hypothetical protein
MYLTQSISMAPKLDTLRLGLTNRFCNQLGQNIFLVMLGNRSDDGSQRRCVLKLVLLGDLVPQRIEVDIFGRSAILSGFMVLDEGVGDVGTAPQETLTLWSEIGRLPVRRNGRGRNCGCRHIDTSRGKRSYGALLSLVCCDDAPRQRDEACRFDFFFPLQRQRWSAAFPREQMCLCSTSHGLQWGLEPQCIETPPRFGSQGRDPAVTTVVLPWQHWKPPWLAFLQRRSGARRRSRKISQP